MSSQAWLGTVLALALLVLLALLFVVRLRSVAGRLGSFECAWRPSHTTRWSSGVAMFTNDALRWYRLMSLAASPTYLGAVDSSQATRAEWESSCMASSKTTSPEVQGTSTTLEPAPRRLAGPISR